mmetsp:Transcript_5914/g.14222  ORF Transcript_5914/g.14222 Transcript_5914/m.14222 type:complete len:121 (+) Transcript_5914:466-828(+)
MHVQHTCACMQVHNIQQWQQRADIEGVGMGRQQALSTLRISANNHRAKIAKCKERNVMKKRGGKTNKQKQGKSDKRRTSESGDIHLQASRCRTSIISSLFQSVQSHVTVYKITACKCRHE